MNDLMRTVFGFLAGPGLLLWLTILLGITASAQPESSAFTLTGMAASTPFARDYQALTINPANLDFETGYDQRSALGLFDFTASLYTELLTSKRKRPP